MKEFFLDAIRINQTQGPEQRENDARQLFDRLNTMEMPSHFNWAKEVFEDLHAKTNPSKTALIWSDLDTLETRSFSYGTLLEKANQMINLFARNGFEKGDNLYVMSPAYPENWFAGIACIKSGMVIVPTATSMTQRELEFRFETYPPKFILADEVSATIIDKALEEAGASPKLKVVIGHCPECAGWTESSEMDEEDSDAPAAQTASDDMLFCFFTSGTTGLPKRVGHTAVSYPVGHLTTTLMIGLTADDIHHNLTTPGWSKWTWSSFFVPFNVGATTTGFKYSIPDVEQYLDALSRHQITTLCAPPTAWRKFVNMNLSSFSLPKLKESVCVGESLHPDVISKWESHTGTVIRDFYGQTETTAVIGNPPWMKERMRIGSFGVPLFMYDVALTDDEGNEIKNPGQTGHLVIKLDQWRGLGLFTEYIGSPEKMSSVFVDHYYYTGDKAYFDEDGYWWFDGRADDVIKSSDFRIGPFEVESTLLEHPAVMETAVIGAPDPNRYQLVKAYVILNPAYQASRTLALELFKHTIAILPKFKIPRIIEFVPEVPKTMSGKIRRVELRKIEGSRQDEPEDGEFKEYFYWDFPELSSKR